MLFMISRISYELSLFLLFRRYYPFYGLGIFKFPVVDGLKEFFMGFRIGINNVLREWLPFLLTMHCLISPFNILIDDLRRFIVISHCYFLVYAWPITLNICWLVRLVSLLLFIVHRDIRDRLILWWLVSFCFKRWFIFFWLISFALIFWLILWWFIFRLFIFWWLVFLLLMFWWFIFWGLIFWLLVFWW